MATKKKTEPQPSEAELQRRHERWMAVASMVHRLLMAVVICSAVVGFAYVTFYLPVQASAGQTTAITVAQQWLADVNAHVYLAWGAAAASGAYGITERRKRIRERGERDKRIAELERRLDPGRTSSGLTPEGKPQT